AQPRVGLLGRDPPEQRHRGDDEQDRHARGGPHVQGDAVEEERRRPEEHADEHHARHHDAAVVVHPTSSARLHPDEFPHSGRKSTTAPVERHSARRWPIAGRGGPGGTLRAGRSEGRAPMSRGISAEYWQHLRPFAPPHANQRMAFVGLAAFVGSVAEAGVLVIVTMTADSLIREADHLELLGRVLPRTDAVLLALGLVVVRIAMSLVAVRTASRFSATVLERAQRSLLYAYIGTSHEARAAMPAGDLTALSSSTRRSTGYRATD